MMLLRYLLIVGICTTLCFRSFSQEITSLPGLRESIKFRQYAGSVVVDETHGRTLFYWFVESQRDPSKDPVLLWLQGGPGCSSLGGLFEELGPFVPFENNTVGLNPYSWNKISNVIFLESPSGVGFSYSNTTADYIVGDHRTAQDSVTFLVKFFETYPQFSHLPFWVTGESYGGHYVPNLASAILDYNSVMSHAKINLQGFMVGNAWTDPTFDNFGATKFWYSHALISEKTFEGMQKNCNFSDIGPLGIDINIDECQQNRMNAYKEMGDINVYSIYSNVCTRPRYRDGIQLMHQINDDVDVFAEVVNQKRLTENPCVGSFTAKYLNDKAVQKAIHAPNIKWEMCNAETLHYSRSDLLSSMLPVYRNLFGKIRILVYSGDVDGMVPNTGTKMWLDRLNLTVVNDWHNWTGNDGQVAGYATNYKEMTFTTIRGAGHMVPQDQPRRALDMVTKFNSGSL
ncbi:uncharacterized protein LOC134178668 [Corticium candelabrum]|uniref:uncharacterized protein LOC134178668 n=1 Tax=Corticium candelabrum TaxID=121492 RepID=UPI002E258BFA|nr:uncharacterized protein LOC134178668 [Corticium candelabrum]